MKQIHINGEDRTADVRAFADLMQFDTLIPGRYSVGFMVDLFCYGWLSGQVSPHKIMAEIRALEGHGVSLTKPATRFNRPPLKGLWHKHHLMDGIASMAQNLKLSIERSGLP